MILLLLACGTPDPGFDTAPDDTAGGPPASDVAAGDLLITEVMFDPSKVDGDFGEWFEVLNLSGAELDLAGVVVQDDDASGFAIEAGLVVPAGGRAVFGTSADTTLNGGVPVDLGYSVDLVKLGNEGDTLGLYAGGALIDAFTWDEAVMTLAEGAALQLSSTVTDAAGNDDPTAWCLATSPYGDGDLGTPGAPNDGC